MLQLPTPLCICLDSEIVNVIHNPNIPELVWFVLEWTKNVNSTYKQYCSESNGNLLTIQISNKFSSGYATYRNGYAEDKCLCTTTTKKHNCSTSNKVINLNKCHLKLISFFNLKITSVNSI